jgi:hypothetical protein
MLRNWFTYMETSFPKLHLFSLFPSYTKNSGARDGCILDPQIFNICINVVRDSDFNCSCVVLNEDIKFFHIINNVEGCKVLQFNFDAVK